MASRVGNQRASLPPHGKDLYFGWLLFEAIWERHDKHGQRFSEEYERLYQRWRRLVKGIIAYNGGMTPLGALENTDRDILILHPRNRYYPKPRPLTPEEQVSLEWRTAISNDACQEIFVNLRGMSVEAIFDWRRSTGRFGRMLQAS